MAPLEAYQARKPAEDLQPSQGNTFERSKQKKSYLWRVGTWNVR